MAKGYIFDIKRYSIHDGPGIRTTIFFKGCPLSCRWCHNPESISAKPQLVYYEDRCISCNQCVHICPQIAISAKHSQSSLYSEHNKKNSPAELQPVIDREKCNFCQKCEVICPAKAIEFAGKPHTVDPLVQIIEKDILFFDQSGGGVTFSGGEPFLQTDFLFDLLDACEKKGIHRTVDTCGFTSKNYLSKIAKKTDLFLYDLKLMDSQKHIIYTGVSNEIILKNLVLLSKVHSNIIIRFPLIPGINDDEVNIENMGTFLSNLNSIQFVDILPFHHAAKGKYKKFGISYQMDEIIEPDNQLIQKTTDHLKRFGFKIRIGG